MKIFSLYLELALMEWFCFNLCRGLIATNESSRFYCYFAHDECPNKDVKFYFYTRDTQNNPLLLDPRNLSSDLFPERLPLKILIHGLGLNYNLSPNQELRVPLLELEHAYVISVDYSSLARIVCYYPWVVSNTRVVAKCLALLLNNLMDQGLYTQNDMHIIGFSLGGQIAGLSANYLNKKYKIGWITGLDPAGNIFDTSNLAERLDPSDAEFVDVIHTNPRFLSTKTAMGHADFYPNFLDIAQPGCHAFEELNICSHFRSNIYYAESIITSVGFWSYNCGNYIDFLYNQCVKYSHIPHVKMGYFVDKSARGSYFLDTNSAPPYAQGPLAQVEFEVVDKNLDKK